MSAFTDINLSKLDPPTVVQTAEFEVYLANMVERYTALVPELAEFIALESDPIRKLLEIVAYEKTLINSRVNSASLANMIAFSTGADLDNLAEIIPLVRFEGQSDDSFREQVQLAPEGFSVAGPTGAYKFHALRSDPSVRDVHVDTLDLYAGNLSPAAQALQAQIFTLTQQFADLTGQPPLGHVHVYTLASATGSLSPEMGSIVLAAISDEEVRPCTDYVEVKSPNVVYYNITAEITVPSGPDRETVRLAALQAAQKYADDNFQLAPYIARTAITAALHVGTVVKLDLTDPPQDLDLTGRQVAVCQSITVTLADVNGGLS